MKGVLNVRETAQEIGLSRSQVYRILESDPSFPRPLQLSVKRIGWIREEVQAWVKSRPRVRGNSGKN